MAGLSLGLTLYQRARQQRRRTGRPGAVTHFRADQDDQGGVCGRRNVISSTDDPEAVTCLACAEILTLLDGQAAAKVEP